MAHGKQETTFPYANSRSLYVLLDWRASREFPDLRERQVFVCKSEPIGAPRFGVWINLGWFDNSVADLKSIASPNANYFVANAAVSRAIQPLLVNRSIILAGNLSVREFAAGKMFW